MLKNAKFQQLKAYPVTVYSTSPHLELQNYRIKEESLKRRQIHTHIQHTVSEESEGSMLVREKEEEYAE